MHIPKLKHFIKASNEDFADAHEPVNDGVKAVPTAKDIAAQVGRKGGDGSTDITSQGEATIIEEKVDDEDTGTEMTEQVTTDTDANDIVEETETTETESPAEDEPELAHDDVKEVETDEKVTAKEKESLEAFVPLLKRTELIGYSKRQTETLSKSIRTIRAKAGLKGPVTVSTESIHEAIGIAETHLVKLARKRKFLSQRVSVENVTEVVAPINEEPLAHEGAVPLSATQGVAITDAELGPVVDTVVEQQAAQDVMNQIGQLQNAGVAIERFVQLLRDNKGRVSKQTAAIIHAGLEHIDTTCNLRRRATGLENFDTTPRMAMESTDVDEKSLGSRAAEIGAKILKLLQELWDRAANMYEKYMSGLAMIENNAEQLLESLKTNKATKAISQFELSQTRSVMFKNGEFVGLDVTREEEAVVKDMEATAKRILGKGVGPVAAALKNGDMGDAMDIITTLESGNTSISLPGGCSYSRDGITVSYFEDKESDFPDEVTVETTRTPELVRATNSILKYVNILTQNETMSVLRKSNRELAKGIGELRKIAKSNDDFDETVFQSMQNTLVEGLVTPFDLPKYVSIVGKLANMISPRLAIINKIHQASIGTKEPAQA